MKLLHPDAPRSSVPYITEDPDTIGIARGKETKHVQPPRSDHLRPRPVRGPALHPEPADPGHRRAGPPGFWPERGTGPGGASEPGAGGHPGLLAVREPAHRSPRVR